MSDKDPWTYLGVIEADEWLALHACSTCGALVVDKNEAMRRHLVWHDPNALT